MACDVSGERRELGARQREAVLRAFGGLWPHAEEEVEDPKTVFAALLSVVWAKASSTGRRTGRPPLHGVPGTPGTL